MTSKKIKLQLKKKQDLANDAKSQNAGKPNDKRRPNGHGGGKKMTTSAHFAKMVANNTFVFDKEGITGVINSMVYHN
jgi:hypothetical protein